MNQEEIQKKNDLLAQISALKASINGLELTNNKDYKDLIKGNKEALKVVEKELEKLIKEIEKRQQDEIILKQELKQKQIADEFKALAAYFAYISKLKVDDKIDKKKLGQFKQMKRHPHISRRLKLLGF